MLLLLAAGAAAGPAQAHAPVAGVGPFWAGVLHPLLSPALLMVLLALGLQWAQRAARPGLSPHWRGLRVPMTGYALAAALGLAASLALGEPALDRLLLLGAACTALPVALAWPLPNAVALSLALALGAAAGLAAGPGVPAAQAPRADLALTLAGAWLGLLWVPGWLAVLAAPVQRAWLRMAQRVLASWVASAALLVLALSFAPPRRAPTPAPPAPPAASAPVRRAAVFATTPPVVVRQPGTGGR